MCFLSVYVLLYVLGINAFVTLNQFTGETRNVWKTFTYRTSYVTLDRFKRETPSSLYTSFDTIGMHDTTRLLNVCVYPHLDSSWCVTSKRIYIDSSGPSLVEIRLLQLRLS